VQHTPLQVSLHKSLWRVDLYIVDCIPTLPIELAAATAKLDDERG
jgi:hypothetical protein